MNILNTIREIVVNTLATITLLIISPFLVLYWVGQTRKHNRGKCKRDNCVPCFLMEVNQ